MGGWDIQQSVELARQLKELGVDLIDCSSGGNVANAQVPVGPGYQTSFAERMRREAKIMTGAVGMITSPVQAEHILATEQPDAVISPANSCVIQTGHRERPASWAGHLVAGSISQGCPRRRKGSRSPKTSRI